MTWICNKKQCKAPLNDCNWIESKSENEALEMDGVAVHKCKVCQRNLEKI